MEFTTDKRENENRKEEQPLQNAELEELLNRIPAGVAVNRMCKGIITPVAANERALHLLHAKPGEIGSNDQHLFTSRIHPDDLKEVTARMSGLNAPGGHARFQMRFRSGEDYIWLLVEAVSVSAEKDEILVYSVITDISSEKAAEEKEEKEKERLVAQYRAAERFTELVSQSYHATRRINLTRNQVEKVGGISPLSSVKRAADYDESIKALLDLMPWEEDRRRCAEFFSRENLFHAYESGQRQLSEEYRIRYSGGEFLWLRSNLMLTERPDSGDLIAFSAVSDISDAMEGRLVEQKLTHDEFDFIAVIDLEKDRMKVRNLRPEAEFEGPVENEPFSVYMKRYMAETVEPDYLEHVLRLSEPDMVREQLRKASTFSFSFERHGKSGIRRMKQLRYSYLDDTLSRILLVQTDVTELNDQEKKYQEEMRMALASARQASNAKSNFLSRMSHEIRTPLNAIIGMDTIAAQSIGNDTKIADCISKIGLSSRYLLSLINDILDMSRIESGKMLLKNESFRFADLITGINTIIYNQASAKGLDYECTVANDVEEGYTGDAMKLQQILVNVLGNAVKFTERGKISMDISVVSRQKNQVKLRFVVNDTGIGIREEMIPKIFEPFEQGDTSTTTVFGGTGLGLAITKNLAGLMGGSIFARSILGVGSEFTVDIPMTVDESARKQRIVDISNLKNLHTLVVDDDLVICEQASVILKEIGMIGELATSGQEAVGKVRLKSENKSYYDFILIDWKMPDMNGIETTREIRKIAGPDVTIIIISAYDWESIEAEAKAAGANLLLSKPLFKSSLVSAFEKAKGRAEEEKERTELICDFTGKRLLVAEDNPLNAEIARDLLEEKHFAVELVPNGLKALERFSRMPEHYFDAILMDIRMPLMDGLQATVNIRHWDRPDAKKIPIIAMTANAFDEDIEKSRAAGMNAHLSKPIDPQMMYITLKRILEENQNPS